MTLRRGAAQKPVSFSGLRSLERDELALLAEKRTAPIVARFRDPHHRVARMFAVGMRMQDIVEQSGYSYVRVAMLAADPSFKELIAQKRLVVDQSFRDAADPYLEIATSNMLKAETMIAEKLEEAMENGETLPTRDLIAISRDAADRFGYGKKQTNLNVNVDFAAKLEQTIARSKTIELKPVAALGTPSSGVLDTRPEARQASSELMRRRA